MKKKTFKLMGIAMITVSMCVSLSSCSNDEPSIEPIFNEYGIITNEKKVVEIKESNFTAMFTYDDKKRLIHYEQWDPRMHSGLSSGDYIWGKNNISGLYILNNGLVTSKEYPTSHWDYGYNSSNQLISYDRETFEWSNGNLVAKYDDYSKKLISIEYGDETCNGYFPIMGMIFYIFFSDSYMSQYALSVAHPEIFGLRTRQLPNKIIDSRHECILEYTFTQDGYIETCTCISTDDIKSIHKLYSFKWQ